MVQSRTVNVFSVSFGFMLLFISFQTMANIMDTIITSVKNDDPGYQADAMDGLFIVYIALAISNFMAPHIIRLLGDRLSMVLGSLTYTAFIASFLMPKAWVLYAVAIVNGFGGALLWTGQGKYLTDNSDNLTIGRNAGIFWAIFQSSSFLGNLFVFFAFKKKDGDEMGKFIDKDTRKQIFMLLTAVSCAGNIFLCSLRKSATVNGQSESKPSTGSSVLSAIKLFGHGRILLLSFSFWFTGAILSFAGSVYGNCVGYTLKIAEDPKPLVGLVGVCFSFGEIIGGTIFGYLGPKTVIWGRNPIIALGFVVLTTSFTLIFVNIPNSAPFGNTYDVSFLPQPMKSVALASSLLLGLGDSCLNTQIYSILGTLYHKDSAPAFAVFKLVQAVATGVGFIYTKTLGLRFILIILESLLIIAVPTFMIVERMAVKISQQANTMKIVSSSSDRRKYEMKKYCPIDKHSISEYLDKTISMRHQIHPEIAI